MRDDRDALGHGASSAVSDSTVRGTGILVFFSSVDRFFVRVGREAFRELTRGSGQAQRPTRLLSS
ncbi:hypothetical protein CSX12_06395 [Microbacterium sp. Y-01]|nr:hypothetical protein CSX12_06395 [Microbacterium sp. Y-01]